jgi:hypothetical protein
MPEHTIMALSAIVLSALVQSAWAAPVIDHAQGSPSVPASARYSYKSENLTDGNSTTAWCTRAQRTGTAWIKLYAVEFDAASPGANKPAYWSGFGIFNGYGRSEQSFLSNSRIKEMKMYLDGKFVGNFTARDAMGPQWFALKRTKARELKIEVLSEYRGNRDDDLCVTELFAGPNFIKIYGLLDKIVKDTGVRALSTDEIKKIYHPLLKFITNNTPDEDAVFENAVTLSVDGKGEAQLRMAMDLYYLLDAQSNEDVELEEGVADRLIYFFGSKPKAVLRVWNDKKQVERDQLAGAYETFLGGFDNERLRKYRQEHPDFAKVSSLIEAETGIRP